VIAESRVAEDPVEVEERFASLERAVSL